MWSYGLFYTQVLNSMPWYAVSLMNFWNFSGHSVFQTVFLFFLVWMVEVIIEFCFFTEVNLVTVKDVRLKALEMDVFRQY